MPQNPQRETKTQRLIDDWLNDMDLRSIEHILRNGWTGYDHMTDEQVDADYRGACLDEVYDDE